MKNDRTEIRITTATLTRKTACHTRPAPARPNAIAYCATAQSLTATLACSQGGPPVSGL